MIQKFSVTHWRRIHFVLNLLMKGPPLSQNRFVLYDEIQIILGQSISVHFMTKTVRIAFSFLYINLNNYNYRLSDGSLFLAKLFCIF